MVILGQHFLQGDFPCSSIRRFFTVDYDRSNSMFLTVCFQSGQIHMCSNVKDHDLDHCLIPFTWCVVKYSQAYSSTHWIISKSEKEKLKWLKNDLKLEAIGRGVLFTNIISGFEVHGCSAPWTPCQSIISFGCTLILNLTTPL